MPFVTRKGQVTIPKRMRDTLGIKEGDRVVFALEKKEIIIRKDEKKNLLSLGGMARKKSNIRNAEKTPEEEKRQ